MTVPPSFTNVPADGAWSITLFPSPIINSL